MRSGGMNPDVIIGGGGFIGLSLALALARKGLAVTVADPVTPAAAAEAGFDGRVWTRSRTLEPPAA